MELAPTPRQQMYIQKLYLYMNMTKPSERLYLSYARLSGEGKSLRPSYLISMVRRLFPSVSIRRPEEAAAPSQVQGLSDGRLRDGSLAALRMYGAEGGEGPGYGVCGGGGS